VRHLAFASLVTREWRTSWADRGAYVLRAVYSSALLLGVVAAWVSLPFLYSDHPDSFPHLIRSIFDVFCRAQFVLASVVAAMTFARAVCREQERGTLDLLILSPLSRTEILLGKLAGEFLGLTALVASGIPVMFLLIPLGGLSPLQILSVQGVLLAHVLVVGGVCVALASALGRTLPVMICAWAAVALLVFGPDLGRDWISKRAWIWIAWESLSTYGILDRQLTNVQPEPALTLKALGIAAILGVFFCGLGSLVLERSYLRGARTGPFAALAIRIRRYSGTLSGRRLFRHLFPVEHPLMRRELAVDRDIAFRISWLALVLSYAAVFRYIVGRPGWSEEEHFELSLTGLATAALIAAVVGAFQVASDRRRGTLQALLAAGVSPEDLVRSRLAGLVLRAIFLVAIPAAHLIWISAYMKVVPKGELLWRIPAALTGLVLGIVLVMEAIIQVAFSNRRPEVAAVLAVVSLPLGAVVAVFVGGTLSSFAVGVPLMIVGIVGAYAFLVRNTAKWVLR
jgi:ABC-type transport system involved in multi-copper enzyme maturation permease subunit